MKYKVGDRVRCLCSERCQWWPGDCSCHPDRKFTITYVSGGPRPHIFWKGRDPSTANIHFCPSDCVELIQNARIVGNELVLDDT